MPHNSLLAQPASGLRQCHFGFNARIIAGVVAIFLSESILVQRQSGSPQFCGSLPCLTSYHVLVTILPHSQRQSACCACPFFFGCRNSTVSLPYFLNRSCSCRLVSGGLSGRSLNLSRRNSATKTRLPIASYTLFPQESVSTYWTHKPVSGSTRRYGTWQPNGHSFMLSPWHVAQL